jgi:RND family efflux transporter MFP subunit
MSSHNAVEEASASPQTHRPVRALRFVLLIGVAAVGLAASGVASRREEAAHLARWTAEQAVPTVTLTSLKPETETHKLKLPGDVEALYSASIHGQASGYVKEWRADIGALVRRGEILAIVDTPELDQRITASEGELAKSASKQQLARVTAERWRALRNSSAVSQQAIDEKESDARAADADAAAAKANLDRLRALKTFSNIVAPFEGVVTARNVDIGSLISTNAANAAPQFVVADVSRMRVYVRAPQVYGADLRKGMKAELVLPEYPGRTFPATIATTSDAIDAKSRSLLVELTADNKEGLLRPGAYAQVRFEIAPDANAVSLPASALVFRGKGTFVATVDDHSRVKLEKIEIARDFGATVQVAAGLSRDVKVIDNPPESLADGDEVRIAQEPAAKGAANVADAGAKSH